MRGILKWVMASVLGCVVLVAFAAILVVLVLNRSVAPDSLEAKLDGLQAPVEIVFDKEAVPHIKARSHADAARALGYVHARDRLWQMEVLRMAGQGRLSEMFGDATLKTDRFLRTINMADAARSSFDALLPETKNLVQAYVAGVNAFMTRDTDLLEPGLGAEFLILGHTPERWEPWQSVLVIKVMGLTLGANMDLEIARFALARQGFSSKEIDDLMPYGPRDNPPALPDLLKIYGMEPLSEETKVSQVLQKVSPGFELDWPTGQSASNNWVISGERTASGKPILANDPHLGFTAPSTFHLAHLLWEEDGEQRHVIGGAVPGTPFIVVGRTNDVAWGLTTTNLDAQDLFLERIDSNQENYLTENGWNPIELNETDLIAGGKVAETLIVRNTRHGPLLPADYGNISAFLPEGYGLALNWPGLAHDDTTLDGLYLNNIARSVQDMLKAGERTVSPMQSVVMADRDGNIALSAHARSPLRKPENIIFGRAPVPGWLPQYHWSGYRAQSDLLTIENPTAGAITTANANYLPAEYRSHITFDWAEHFRQARAEQLILGRNQPHTIQSSLEAISDAYSPAMVRFRDLAKRIMADGVGTLPEVRDALDEWDGRMDATRPEPLIMLAWFRHLNIEMLEDDLGDLFEKFERGRITRLLGMLERAGARNWCDNQITPEFENCDQTLSIALQKAFDELSAEYGEDWRNWKYGDGHKAYHEHRPFGQVGALARFFNIEVPVSGGPYTLLRGQTKFQEDRPYLSRHGAAFRAIYDFSDLDQSMFIQSTGQSGNFMSPYYDNFSQRWANVEFIPMTTREADYTQDAIGTWALNP